MSSEQSTYPHGEHLWFPGTPPSPMLVRAADRLFAECERAIRAGRLDARSPVGDATLDYRQERDDMEHRAQLDLERVGGDGK